MGIKIIFFYFYFTISVLLPITKPVLLIFVGLKIPSSGNSIPKCIYHYNYYYNYNISWELNVPSSGNSIPKCIYHNLLNLK